MSLFSFSEFGRFFDKLEEKISLKSDKKTYLKAISDAYQKEPLFDKTVVYAWDALNKSNYSWFNKIVKDCTLIFYSEQPIQEDFIKIKGKKYDLVYLDKSPYKNQKEMKADYDNNKSIYIGIDYSEHPIFSLEDNIVFRFVHDFLVHIKGDFSFGTGEINCYNLHIRLVPKDAIGALFTEVLAQAAVAMTTGNFPTQKICLLKEFDWLNIGYTSDGELI